MTTPTVPPTSEPVEVPPTEDPCIVHDFGPSKLGTTRDGLLPCDPATGEIVEWPVATTAPLPDDCIPTENTTEYPGVTRHTLLPCDPATGDILAWPPQQAVESVATVAVRSDPAPELQELPATGAAETAVMLTIAAGLLTVGASLRRFARR
jgi:hypothetical protein